MGKKILISYIKLSKAIGENPPVCSEPEYRELFFTDFVDRNRPLSEMQRRLIQNEREAKIICDFCPVKLLCAEYAILAHEPYGIWGGTTPADRKLIAAVAKEKN